MGVNVYAKGLNGNGWYLIDTYGGKRTLFSEHRFATRKEALDASWTYSRPLIVMYWDGYEWNGDED